MKYDVVWKYLAEAELAQTETEKVPDTFYVPLLRAQVVKGTQSITKIKPRKFRSVYGEGGGGGGTRMGCVTATALLAFSLPVVVRTTAL